MLAHLDEDARRVVSEGAFTMSVLTPREPALPRQRSAHVEAATYTHGAEFATRWSHLDVAVASGRGTRHAVNEDSSSALAGTAPLFVVADGVGGGAMAALASREVVLRLHGALEDGPVDAPAIRAALLDADRDVARSIAHYGTRTGAATVALCAGATPRLSKWLVAWVGDCRVYKIGAAPDCPALLLTRDDTYRHLGEEPPPGGSPDDPARMVGNGAVTAPNIVAVDLRPGETLALCSDGIHKHVEPDMLRRVVHEPTSLAQRCLRLVKLARTFGGHDDATVLIVQRNRRARPRAVLFAYAGILVALVAVALLALRTEVPRWRDGAPAPAPPVESASQPEPKQ
jgi:PPM family protein phosphatase